MLNLLTKPFKKIAEFTPWQNYLSGFYRIRIVNRSKHVIWLAKNTNGDLHDIINPGHILEVRLPKDHPISFYAYKASDSLDITGLDYHAKKDFEKNSTWIIH